MRLSSCPDLRIALPVLAANASFGWLCREGSCCPAVSVFDDRVEIGEDANTCTLTRDEFEILKENILAKEI